MDGVRWLLIILYFILSTSLTHAQMPDSSKKLLKDLVEINSSTDNLEGLELMRQRLIPEFKALGFEYQVIDVSNGHKVLIFQVPSATPKVALVGHIDTVFKKDSPFQKFMDKGDIVVGPGVNDMKGGIVLMLAALQGLKNTKFLKSVKVILNDDEEIGSPYSAPTLKENVKGLAYGLIYEPTLESADHVTTTQAGVQWLEIKVKGVAAHAGAEHEKGINACVELAHKVIQLSKLTNYAKKLTVNPGVIKGGTKANVVCEEASVKVDIRYVDDKDLKNTMNKIKAIVKKSTLHNPLLKKGTESSLLEIVHVPSLTSKSTKFLFERASSLAKTLGFQLKKEHMGGASDANQLAVTGISLLAGLGPWGKGAHSTTEMMDTKSFEKRTKLSMKLIQELAK